eukprot:8749625-Pyramimonas_sp.AAC.1
MDEKLSVGAQKMGYVSNHRGASGYMPAWGPIAGVSAGIYLKITNCAGFSPHNDVNVMGQYEPHLALVDGGNRLVTVREDCVTPA